MRKPGKRPIKRAVPKSRAYRQHELVREHGERQAEVWLALGLRAAGLKSGVLARIQGSDPRKVPLADLLWLRTLVTQEWIAESIPMGSAANVSQQLRRLDRKEAEREVPAAMKEFLEEADDSNP